MKKILTIAILTPALIIQTHSIAAPIKRNVRSNLYLGKGEYNPSNYSQYRCSIGSCTGADCSQANVDIILEKSKIEHSHYTFRMKDHSNIEYLNNKLLNNKKFIKWCHANNCDMTDATITKTSWNDINKYITVRVPVKNTKSAKDVTEEKMISFEVQCVPYNKKRAFKLDRGQEPETPTKNSN